MRKVVQRKVEGKFPQSIDERREVDGMSYKNKEGYSDPVPAMAVSRMEGRIFRPIVYICSPFSGDMEGNAIKARKYCRFAVDQGAIPIAPHLLFPQFIKEETERDLAMQMDMVLLAHCLELWVFGTHISEGMAAEIAEARRRGMPIRHFKKEVTV